MKTAQKTKRILFVPTLNSVIAFYRMQQFVEAMREAEKDFEIAYSYHTPEFSQTCMWEWNLHNPDLCNEFDNLMKYADMAIFQSIHTHEAVALIQILKDKYRKPIFAEFDDDPYSVSSDHFNYDPIAPGSNTELFTHAQVKRSDGIIVSTDYLKGIFRKNNKNVYTIPNGINFDFWDSLEAPEPHGDLIYIGWSGGANHYPDLELIEEPILKILKKHSNARFVIFTGGELPDAYKDHEQVICYDHTHWQPINLYPQFLKSLGFDIGLAPLRDSNFNRAKSNLKWLEYSALQIPTVASPVEPYLNSQCSLARNEEDWFNKIDYLIKNPKERNYKGQIAYNYCRENFDIKKIAKKYAKLIRKIIK